MSRKVVIVALVVSLTLALGWKYAARAASANQSPRILITEPVDETNLVTLVGNTRPEAEKAFADYLETLTDKSSSNFRQWMTAQEQGEKYGSGAGRH